MKTEIKQNNVPSQKSDFESEVLKALQPVLVLFFAPWSQPCRVIEKVVDRFAENCGGIVKVFKINADDHPGLSLFYDIESIPSLLYFVKGKVYARSVGTVTAAAILCQWESILSEITPSKTQTKNQSNRIK